MGNDLKTLFLSLVLANAVSAEGFLYGSGKDKVAWSEEELVCVARTIYHEARGEPAEGQIAVAESVFNRAASGFWPSNLCAVVFQPWQYSWTHEVEGIETDEKAYQQAISIAYGVAIGAYSSRCYDNNHYHTWWISPEWSEGLEPCVIGNHYFFSFGN